MNPVSLNSLELQRGARAATKKADGKGDAHLKKICADFESIFIYQLLETMRKTIPEGGYLSNQDSSWKDTCMVLFDQKVAEALASRGTGLGLQKIIYDQVRKDEKVDDAG